MMTGLSYKKTMNNFGVTDTQLRVVTKFPGRGPNWTFWARTTSSKS